MSHLEPVLLFTASSEEQLLQQLGQGNAPAQLPLQLKESYRLGIFNPTPQRLLKAQDIVKKGKPCRGVQGIWYESQGLLKAGGKLAFMFPGIDSQQPIDISDVATHFGEKSILSADKSLLENRGLHTFATSQLTAQILGKMGIKPDLIFGHSFGEWIGLVACGASSQASVSTVMEALKPGKLQVPDVVFAALGCGVDIAQEVIQNLPEIVVSHDNCPHQAIICGSEQSIDTALEQLKAKSVVCQKLDFRSGFHTPFFKPYIEPLKKLFAELSFQEQKVPLWSATSCAPYPKGETEIQNLMWRHIIEKVRFRELTEALYADGCKVFVQVGVGSLTGFVGDTLRGKPHQALSTTTAKCSGLVGLQRFCMALFIEGADFDLDFLLGKKRVTGS